MKVFIRIDDDDTEPMFMLNLESENQKESAQLFEIAQRVTKPVKAYGKLADSYTWIWVKVPLKTKWQEYFGNEL
jgi:hypothetical protein